MGQYNSVFDIIGPVMIGPSSSHTAGAARIGKVIRRILGEQPLSVDIYLYESFAKTYRGHGTDIALVGGLLGMDPDDDRLAKSLEIAHEKGMEVAFIPKIEKADHPNQVKMILKTKDRSMTCTGISIGGGSIQISELNGFKINLDFSTPTYITFHQDKPGVVANVTRLLSEKNINISTMTLTREAKGEKAMMIIEVDNRVDGLLDSLRQIEHIDAVDFFN
ncbi:MULTISPECIES: L-serine ammonia-lyase, iron-sulfur-dependent subunit beta [Enterococcaceae]|uniref:L-serine ammonia-lyase, iron-sulfur-dependent subunit beta n=1 Tax=Enterococcaceae TaxID=81852 RepID=UPI000E49406D|nr:MULTISPECIES: L-serine ammonia-lyase, iron-sulfur-dependent subunit beta [Enterococcaceae]MCI0130431.1 L-serine ammonia-lyase, iron-sulfur-dependent subunit beta [Vagococcus sp. CY53-2]RGI32159.1 L-serine ammonia-lyase, iron-sulfur-dependent, subunit beta [Melissococcus sp. OM08-11BH]UNM89866.1 L-serine ammonia-lyase, iron-sulfur-dependent subunit beta [Vagococcus sp. CY52-2]